MTNEFRKHFPIFRARLERESLTYLDSAATTLKPSPVINAVSHFYEHATSNVYRGNSLMAEEVGLAFGEAREAVASFLNAMTHEVVFSRNCTDSINIVCDGVRADLGDEVVISTLEHHSNFIPWTKKFVVKVVPTDAFGVIDLSALKNAITPRTKLIALTSASNVTGNIQPIKKAVQIANENKILSLVDASQTVSHMPTDVKDIGCSFLCFSAHKMFGPSGVGVLYGKQEALNALHVSRFGGGIVNQFDGQSGWSYKEIPYRLEAGTPNIEGCLGLAQAVRFISNIGFPVIEAQNRKLERHIRERFNKLVGIKRLFPVAEDRVPIVTFRLAQSDLDVNYIARILADRHGLMVTAGLQCAAPLYASVGEKGGIRASFHIYNTVEEVDSLASALDELSNLMG